MDIVAELSAARKPPRKKPRPAPELKRAMHSSLNPEPQTLNP
jgi:hypothetical protein